MKSRNPSLLSNSGPPRRAAALPKRPNCIAPISFRDQFTVEIIASDKFPKSLFLQILILIIATPRRHKTTINQVLLLCSSSHSRYRGDPTLGATARLDACRLCSAFVSAAVPGSAATDGSARRAHPALRTVAVPSLLS
jgi:hypothetical protein